MHRPGFEPGSKAHFVVKRPLEGLYLLVPMHFTYGTPSRWTTDALCPFRWAFILFINLLYLYPITPSKTITAIVLKISVIIKAMPTYKTVAYKQFFPIRYFSLRLSAPFSIPFAKIVKI